MKNIFIKIANKLSSFKVKPHVAGESIVRRSVKGGTITSIGIRRSPIVVTEADRKLFNLSPKIYPKKEN